MALVAMMTLAMAENVDDICTRMLIPIEPTIMTAIHGSEMNQNKTNDQQV
jgi:hypothetical protein